MWEPPRSWTPGESLFFFFSTESLQQSFSTACSLSTLGSHPDTTTCGRCRVTRMGKYLALVPKKKERETQEVHRIRTRLATFPASRKAERVINNLKGSHFQNWASCTQTNRGCKEPIPSPSEGAVTYLSIASWGCSRPQPGGGLDRNLHACSRCGPLETV